MAAALQPPTRLMTVEEFAQLPETGARMELRHGVPTTMPPIKLRHWIVQQQLLRILAQQLGPRGVVGTEIPFRPAEQHEVWKADLGFVSRERWAESVAQDWLRGAPELVVEVLSPSNSVTEMLDRERVCRAGGCLEFWLIDPDTRLIRITDRAGIARTFEAGQQIESEFANGLAVDQVFAEI
jgi:Uma2 family endonuclease